MENETKEYFQMLQDLYHVFLPFSSGLGTQSEPIVVEASPDYVKAQYDFIDCQHRLLRVNYRVLSQELHYDEGRAIDVIKIEKTFPNADIEIEAFYFDVSANLNKS